MEFDNERMSDLNKKRVRDVNYRWGGNYLAKNILLCLSIIHTICLDEMFLFEGFHSQYLIGLLEDNLVDLNV